MHPSLADPASDSIEATVVGPDALDALLERLSDGARDWASRHGFRGAVGDAVLLPPERGGAPRALLGWGTPEARSRGRFALAAAFRKLPEGTYHLGDRPPDLDPGIETLGCLLDGYRFDRYAERTPPAARLVAPEGIDRARVEALAAGEFLTRDLINTPAADMGPEELEDAIATLAARHGAAFRAVRGEALLAEGFPLVHAVGRAAARPPRIAELRWGDDGPLVTLVGKGICFDTGGLDLKPAQAMKLMKKDMGGAATVLGLAHVIMDLGLKLRLRVIVPAAENAVSGAAFRPGDILRARNGLTVEVNNTDAEGRLVLADALAWGAEERPDLLVSMATLTGAARVALGPDLAPFFTDDDALPAGIEDAARALADPVWRLPFWSPYESMLEPGVADLDNAPAGGFAGAITAALFLRRFVGSARYAHFDIYGWQPKDQPGRPKGGVGQGARALLGAIEASLTP